MDCFHKPSEVNRVASLTVDWMRTIQNTSHPLADYVPAIISTWDSGLDLICHNAPHLLFAHVPIEPIDDPKIGRAHVSLTHFDIAAPAFGIGTCAKSKWGALWQIKSKPLSQVEIIAGT